MKKNLILGLMFAMIVLVTVTTGNAYAETIKEDLALLKKYLQTPYFNIDSNNSDLDNNGTIDYSDYSQLKDLVK